MPVIYIVITCALMTLTAVSTGCTVNNDWMYTRFGDPVPYADLQDPIVQQMGYNRSTLEAMPEARGLFGNPNGGMITSVAYDWQTHTITSQVPLVAGGAIWQLDSVHSKPKNTDYYNYQGMRQLLEIDRKTGQVINTLDIGDEAPWRVLTGGAQQETLVIFYATPDQEGYPIGIFDTASNTMVSKSLHYDEQLVWAAAGPDGRIFYTTSASDYTKTLWCLDVDTQTISKIHSENNADVGLWFGCNTSNTIIIKEITEPEVFNPALGKYLHVPPVLLEIENGSNTVSRTIALTLEQPWHYLWWIFYYKGQIIALAGPGRDGNFYDGLTDGIEWWFYRLDPATGRVSKIDSEALHKHWISSPVYQRDNQLVAIDGRDGYWHVTHYNLDDFTLAWEGDVRP